MKLLRVLKPEAAFVHGTVASLGNFDGVHLGHQALIYTLKAKALELNLPLVLLLFEPQPAEFLFPQAPPRLSTLREKLGLLKELGVDYVYCLRFNQNLASLSPESFAETYFFTFLRTQYFLVGKDFRFGHQRQGSLELLQTLAEKRGAVVEACTDFLVHDQRVSSTKIRQALNEGRLDEAKSLLGRSYSLCGRVKIGQGKGREWGVPTANIRMKDRPSLALKGVFCVEVRLSSGLIYPGVANLGSRPTLGGEHLVLEVHLFNFNHDLYGQFIDVIFCKKIREEKAFSSLNALIEQIYQDITEAKTYFKL